MISSKDNGVIIEIRVVPRAAHSEIAGAIDGVLKVRLHAPPVDGAANDELVRLIARHFGVGKSSVRIIAGSAAKRKRVFIEGIEESTASSILSV